MPDCGCSPLCLTDWLYLLFSSSTSSASSLPADWHHWPWEILAVFNPWLFDDLFYNEFFFPQIRCLCLSSCSLFCLSSLPPPPSSLLPLSFSCSHFHSSSHTLSCSPLLLLVLTLHYLQVPWSQIHPSADIHSQFLWRASLFICCICIKEGTHVLWRCGKLC